MSRQDAAIKAWVLSDPDGVAAVLDAGTLLEDGHRLWQGAKTPEGSGLVPRDGLYLVVHRLAYALYRGPDALPVGRASRGRNDPVITRLCLRMGCVTDHHLARVRRCHVGWTPLDPVPLVLPDEPRYWAENKWRALAPIH